MDGGTLGEDETALYLVLDGGGARGVAHVAAWRVLDTMVRKPGGPKPELPEELGAKRYVLAGVAGTSAGAIAAAFIAAGAKPDDLIDTKGRVPLLSELRLRRFSEIFGIRGWRRLENLRRLAPPNSLKTTINDLRSEIGGDDSPQEDVPETDPDDRHSPKIDAIIVFVLACAFIPAASELFADFSPSYFLNWFLTPPYFLLVLWGALHLSLSLTAKAARFLERRARSGPTRSHWKVTRGLVHPIASIGYALVLATALSFLMKLGLFAFVRRPLPPALLWFASEKADVLDPVIWGIDGAFGATSIIIVLRRFIKGSIDTDDIQKDLNTALCALLTKTPRGWDGVAKHYDWEPRPELSCLGQKIVDRSPESHIVTFGELYDATKIPLTVVAADAIENRVCVYSSFMNRDDSVAMAVTASLALPIAFRPVRDGTRMLVDGGICSSIPAWVYRKDRNRDPDCKILAIRLELNQFDTWIPQFIDFRESFVNQYREQKRTWAGKLRFLWKYKSLSVTWPFGILANILYTASFGARSLELDASDRLESVILQPPLGLLEFDVPRKRLVDDLKELEGRARYQIENLLWLREEAFIDACGAIANLLVKGAPKPEALAKGHIRMFWADQDGKSPAVRIKHTFAFDPEHHFDDRLIMPFGTSMSAWATQFKKSQFGANDVLVQMLAGRMNRYRVAVKWKARAWCWAIPVRHPDTEQVIGVLAVESNLPLTDYDKEVGLEGERRSSEWLQHGSSKIRDRKELAEIAERSHATGKMKDWEEDFERSLQTRFARLKVP
jgi:predicted acylesterase/phospholipase RssA